MKNFIDHQDRTIANLVFGPFGPLGHENHEKSRFYISIYKCIKKKEISRLCGLATGRTIGRCLFFNTFIYRSKLFFLHLEGENSFYFLGLPERLSPCRVNLKMFFKDYSYDSALDLYRICYWHGVCVWAWFSLILC